jgi:hypothetical protein
MINEQWIKSLNPSQLRRRYKCGKVPTFAIFKIYNHATKEWQFKDISSDNPYEVWHGLVKKIGNDVRKWRFEVDVFLYFNPLTLEWEEKRYFPKRKIHVPNEHDLIIMATVEAKCKRWLKQEHLEWEDKQ